MSSRPFAPLTVLCVLVWATALACGAGSGPTLEELLARPVVADGCPLGREIARRTVKRSSIASASVELTCAADASTESVLSRIDSLVGEYDGKTPWVDPARYREIGGTPASGNSAPVGTTSFFWQPGRLEVEVRVLTGSDVPADSRSRTTYRVTVRGNPLAR